MRILTTTCGVLVACLVAAQGAKADDLSRLLATRGVKGVDLSRPFVFVSVPKKPLNLGEVYGPSLREVGGQATAHVVANCPFHISVSFDGLRHQRSKVAISPKHLMATVNGREVPIGVGRVPVVSQGPTPLAGVDVPLDLQVGVRAVASYPAGRYGGTLMLTVTPGH